MVSPEILHMETETMQSFMWTFIIELFFRSVRKSNLRTREIEISKLLLIHVLKNTI